MSYITYLFQHVDFPVPLLCRSLSNLYLYTLSRSVVGGCVCEVGRQAGLLFTNMIVHGLVIFSSKTVVQIEHIAPDDIVRWMFEEIDSDSDQLRRTSGKNLLVCRTI